MITLERERLARRETAAKVLKRRDCGHWSVHRAMVGKVSLCWECERVLLKDGEITLESGIHLESPGTPCTRCGTPGHQCTSTNVGPRVRRFTLAKPDAAPFGDPSKRRCDHVEDRSRPLYATLVIATGDRTIRLGCCSSCEHRISTVLPVMAVGTAVRLVDVHLAPTVLR